MDKFILVALSCFLSFVAVSGCGYGFRKEGGKPALVTWTGNGRTIRYIDGVDPKTFKALDYAEDAQAIYAIDANHVYYSNKHFALPIEGANPEHFKIIASDGEYSADNEHVYWFGAEIPGADPESFRIAKAPYAIDNKRAYAGIMPFDVHSLKDFEVVSVSGFNRPIVARSSRLVVKDPEEAYVSGWSRDGVAYYWGATELEGADYDSLTILNGWHAKDKNMVYCKGEPIPGADAESFVTVGQGVTKGRDKNYEYKEGQRVGRAK
jgi:hypothetical protein